VNAPTIRLLLIEDNPGDARLIREFLAERGNGLFGLEWAAGLAEGLARLEAGGVDLVLLDLSLPGSQGLATLERVLRAAPALPVIVLTGLDDEAAAVEAVRKGAQDYLVKGQFDGGLLVRAARYAVQRQRADAALRQANEALATANARLEDANRRLRELASVDDVTGIPNRRRFMEMLRHEFERVRRRGGGLSLALLDVDHFKVINDTHGHAFGDRVLKALAGALRQGARGADIVARYGGDEFVVLMPDTSLRGALCAATRLHRETTGLDVSDGAAAVRVTFSLGLAAAGGPAGGTPEGLIHMADEALYAAKRAGRNAIRTWNQAAREQPALPK
jgi:diguanylate cyclase (GGDEF)-like protein